MGVVDLVDDRALEGLHVVDVQVVEVALVAGEDDRDLLLDGQRVDTRPCLSTSTRRSPRASCCLRGLVEVGAELRERLPVRGTGARSSRRRPATCFIALICALPPTRLTEMPTLMAGRTPA